MSDDSPHDRLWPWDAVVLAVWLTWSHWWPQDVYAEYRALGTGVLLSLVLLRSLVALRRPEAGRPALVASLIFGALPLWAWVATHWGVNPPAGVEILGTWLEGYLVALWAVLACLARVRSADQTARGGIVALGLLALALSLWGIWDHIVVRPQNLAYLELLARRSPNDEMTLALLHNVAEGRLRSTLGDPNHLGLITALGTVGLLAGALWSSRWVLRGALGLGAAVTLTAELMTGSRGGLLSLIAGVLVLCAPVVARSSRQRRRVIVAGGAVVVLLVAAVGALALSGPPEWLSRLGNVATVRERLGYWGIAWQVFLKNPLMGEGLGGFETWYPSLRPAGLGTTQFAHSLLFQLLAETGVVGLVAALLPLPFLWAPRSPTPKSWPSTGHALTASLSAVGVNALVQYSILFRELWLDAMVLVGLGVGWALSRRNWQPAPPWLWGAAALPPLLCVVMIWPADMVRARAKILDDAATDEIRRGRAQEAIRFTQRLLDLEPGYDLWWVHGAGRLTALAESSPNLRSRLLPQIGEDLQRAEHLNPLRPSTAAAMARLAWLRGDLGAAIAEQREAVRLHPAEPLHHSQLALYLMEAGQMDEAETEARRALALREGDFDSLITLGQVLLRRERWDEAREVAEQAIKADPRRAGGYHLLSRAEHALGDDGAARTAADEALRREPGNPEFQAWRRQLGT